ncbi:TetR/AcrR family transcriptional regulator [Streptomyces sp. NPDC051976]|uniref:TetR/AcrR family transcriptional regulator n=1 Tax=Streptomyces sp. NPDC051976 TaxID=3154947 RepID=UPI00341C03FA
MQALIELMRAHRYESITVQQITDHADVGRSTFYAHFTDKDDLLVDGVRGLVDSLEANGAGKSGPYPSLTLFHHVGDNVDLYLVMARGRSLALFLNALHDEITVKLTDHLTARLPPPAVPLVPIPLLAAMTASMLITAMRSWLEAGATEPAEQVDRAFHIAADAAVRAGLGQANVGGSHLVG